MSSSKQVWIAGGEAFADVGGEVSARADRVRGDERLKPLPPELHARYLAGSQDEGEYARRLFELVRRKAHVDTLGFEPPHRNSWLGRILGRLRGVVWRGLRYQHERMAFRQNLVNSHLLGVIEANHAALVKEVAELRAKVSQREGDAKEGASR
ncbi:MAG TPA: hypothetical protein PKE55_06720 [Kiritimatiellia bacterium]|nr:hypothetical protein [Kiritimatiellia bacterium]